MHICGDGTSCPGTASQFPPDKPRLFVETGLKYAVSGIETGLFASMDRRFDGITTDTPIPWLDDLFSASPRGFTFSEADSDLILFVEPFHFVLEPFEPADLSGWLLSTHNLLSSPVPSGFTAIANGNFFNGTELIPTPVIIVRDDPS